MNVSKVIVNGRKGSTSGETHQQMLRQLEKTFNTGPIIGEAEEVINHLMENLYARDMLLDSLGFDENKRLSAFMAIQNVINQNDEEILKARAGGL